MKIALATYQAAFQNPGGGEVVLNKHYEYLRARGHQVELFDQWRSKIKDFDLVHSFGSINRDFWYAVKECNKPLVVTPILWPQRTLANFLLAKLSRLTIPCASPYSKHPLSFYSDFRLPDRIVVNSPSEGRQICKIFGLSSHNVSVIPNGVTDSFTQADPKLFINHYQTQDYLLCVGRVTGVKNQLGLIHAARGLNQKLVFIGQAEQSRNHYYEQCRAEAEAGTIFIDRLEPDSPMLASAYAAARLVVVPSHFETCGLVAMEAGLAGTQVAITRNGGTRDYYADYVDYLEPRSTKTLRRTLIEALSHKTNPALLCQHIEQNYLWDRVIDRAIELYRGLVTLKDGFDNQPEGEEDYSAAKGAGAAEGNSFVSDDARGLRPSIYATAELKPELTRQPTL